MVPRHRLVLALACLALGTIVLISEASYSRSVAKFDALGTMSEARVNIHALARGLVDTEAGERAFHLTGRAEDRLLYAQARDRVDQSFLFLDGYYADQPEGLETLGRLRTLVSLRLAEVHMAIRETELRLAGAGQFKASAVAAPLPAGHTNLAGIQDLSSDLLQGQAVRIERNRDDVYRSMLISRVGVAALCAIALLGVIANLRQSLALERQRQRRQKRVQADTERLELEVTRRTAQLLELNNHIATAREDERNRLARDLHDELGSLLTSAKLDTSRIKSRLAGGAPELLERLDHLIGTLNSVIAVKRRIGEDLRPSALGHLGLVVTLEILAREFSEQSGIPVECDFTAVRLSPVAQMVVYRLVQEAITNITKYAKATRVWLTLNACDGRVQVSVRDDGVGFDPDAIRRSAYGLVGMKFRVSAEHGSFVVLSVSGQGTTIRVTLPEAPVREPDLTA
jgi:signal transduction histidine kinase